MNLYNDIPEVMKGKTLMITRGTGSFGSTVLSRFLSTDIGEIRIFSRDEKKQDDLRHSLQVRYPEFADKVKFYIGDVRDLQTCKNAMHDKYFKDGEVKRNTLTEFNSNNTRRLSLDETKATIVKLSYIQDNLKEELHKCVGEEKD
jgi:UDP-glucose 4-epimerase